MFNTYNDVNGVPNLYSVGDPPTDTKAMFNYTFRYGALYGTYGGMVNNLQSRGIEYTNTEYDWVDPVDVVRVPLLQGVARIVPVGFGVSEGTAQPPVAPFDSLYPQKGWAKGSFLANATPVESGTAGSKYIITGWICTASGRPGTWVGCRSLTGN